MNKIRLFLVYLTILALIISACNHLKFDISNRSSNTLVDRSSSFGTFIESLNFFNSKDWTITPELLQYHYIVIDQAGNILPWYNPDNLGASYDHIIHLVFEWWLNIQPNPGEPDLPFYLMHRVWRPASDYYTSGIGGDQVAMAISSWRLFYDYTGDQRAIDDMVLMANHVLANGLSTPTDSWPNIPFPYNYTNLETYDGDLIAGPGYTQPDKAGSFGYELLNLYKITGNNSYLQSAIDIANTLASKTQDGDADNSPLPFRVRSTDGAIADAYTTNFSGLLKLWESLIDLGQGNIQDYQTAHTNTINWLKTYPVQNNKWGPFFEDVGGWSDTQINAITLAMYIMEHRQLWGASWQQDTRSALDWAIQEFGNDTWIQYGVQVINEQTAYQAPGNSHTSRQASMELRYAELTGDTTHVQNAIRQLSWANYMVDVDGKNCYLHNDIWLTDGYGDYVRHYLRAMAAAPYLVPDDQDHLLRTTSVIKSISYQPLEIFYESYDTHSQELLRINTFVPAVVTAGNVILPRLYNISDLELQEGYTLGAPGDLPSVVRIRHDHASSVIISGTILPTNTPTPPEIVTSTMTSTPIDTPTPTETPTSSPTCTQTQTATRTPTATHTPTGIWTHLPTNTNTPASTLTPVTTSTPTGTWTNSPTSTVTTTRIISQFKLYLPLIFCLEIHH
jgi:hypothetical protein